MFLQSGENTATVTVCRRYSSHIAQDGLHGNPMEFYVSSMEKKENFQVKSCHPVTVTILK